MREIGLQQTRTSQGKEFTQLESDGKARLPALSIPQPSPSIEPIYEIPTCITADLVLTIYHPTWGRCTHMLCSNQMSSSFTPAEHRLFLAFAHIHTPTWNPLPTPLCPVRHLPFFEGQSLSYCYLNT